MVLHKYSYDISIESVCVCVCIYYGVKMITSLQ